MMLVSFYPTHDFTNNPLLAPPHLLKFKDGLAGMGQDIRTDPAGYLKAHGLSGLGQDYTGFTGEDCIPYDTACVQRNQLRATAAIAGHVAAQNESFRDTCESNNAQNPMWQHDCDRLYPDVNVQAAVQSYQQYGDWGARPDVFVSPETGKPAPPPPQYGGPVPTEAEVTKYVPPATTTTTTKPNETKPPSKQPGEVPATPPKTTAEKLWQDLVGRNGEGPPMPAGNTMLYLAIGVGALLMLRGGDKRNGTRRR